MENEFDGLERDRATLRAAFAAAALQGMCANPNVTMSDDPYKMDLIARLADAMIAALERPPRAPSVLDRMTKPT